MTKKSSFAYVLTLALMCCLFVRPACGVSKEIIQLQAQMQNLQDQMTHMQQSFNENMGVMKNLIEQSTDNINKMNANVDALQKNLSQQNSDTAGKVDQVSAQIQALHDSLDEMKMKVEKLSKQIDAMNAAQQNLTANPSPAPGDAAASQAPPPDVLYNNALRDYNSAKNPLASQEFSDYLKYYSDTDLAGNAQFYLGEIAYKQSNFQQAVKDYDAVLQNYAGNNKSAAAQLKKAYALIELGQREEAIHQLRNLMVRYPHAAEAAQARTRLRKIQGEGSQ